MSSTLKIVWRRTSRMLWGAFLGWVILGSIEQIREAGRHRGPGWVSYEDSDKVVSEAEYRRHKRFYGYFGLGMAGFFWWLSVKRYRKPGRYD